ncbi:MAG: SurA N-terminal domain-containing protein [Nitrosomonadales bacterium]|nr:SurA N-terminal domain-containing protein [Nitrosomonadales bacterium]
MFDFVQNQKRLIQIVLALIILPFAFWGVDSYRKSGGGESLATVNGEKISQQEFDNALRQQQDRMRQMMGDKFDQAMFDKPEIKHSILDNLINQRLLVSQARAVGLTVSDEQLAQVIAGIDSFQKDGKFDKQRYEAALRNQGMSPAVFEERIQQELGLRQLTDGYTRNGFASGTIADRLIRLNGQQRVISTVLLAPEAFVKQATVDEAAVKSYYEKHAEEFQTPEQARVEYVMLSAEALLPQITVDDAEVKNYYDEHQAEFGAAEQIHAAHILITVSAQAPEADKQSAKAKAEQVLQQVKQSPGKFAELARQYSQDPGSAANGGDLGLFGRGMMVKPFEDAAFKLKPGEISGLVQSDFGYHIIKLLGTTPAKVQPLNEAKATISSKLKLQKASDRFAELAEKFSNTVYEQSDTLKSAAELVKLPVQQSVWLSKGQPGAAPWTDKALQAAFSNEVVKDKRNSPAIEVAPNTMLAVRMLEYKPAGARSWAEVSDAIRQKLLRQKALELAYKQGKEVVEQLRRGDKPKLEWKPQTITYAQAASLDSELVRQVFQADAAKLPVYAGMESAQNGYMLIRVEAIKEAGQADDVKRTRYVRQLRQMTGDELLQAYMADTRKRAEINVRLLDEKK